MATVTTAIPRHKTAIRRGDLSRPMKCALHDGLISPAVSVFDYGCGHGQDIALLNDQGIACAGWDPVFRSAEPRTPADVVNLGFVINVIEDPNEKAETGHARFPWETLLDRAGQGLGPESLCQNRLTDLARTTSSGLGGSGLTDAGNKHLAGLTNLEWLDLRETKATAAGIAELLKSLPQVQDRLGRQEMTLGEHEETQTVSEHLDPGIRAQSPRPRAPGRS